MRITYDAAADALSIQLRDAEPGDNMDLAPGVLADLDTAGQIIGLEILSARKKLGEAVFAESVPIEQLVPKAIAAAQ